MAYYLSEENRKLVVLIANRLTNVNIDIKYECRRPESFERILRSACKLPEFSWIKEKYIIKVRKGELLFIIRDLETKEILEPAEQVSGLDFFAILSRLVDKPERIRFVDNTLDDTEVEAIKEWCKENKYLFNNENNIIEVRKDGD